MSRYIGALMKKPNWPTLVWAVGLLIVFLCVVLVRNAQSPCYCSGSVHRPVRDTLVYLCVLIQST